MGERLFVLSMPVDAVDLPGAVARVDDAIAAFRAGTGAPLQVATLNAEMAMQGLEDPEFGAVIQGCGLVVPDGSGVVWALKRRGVPVTKVAGVDFLNALAAHGAQRGHRFFFLGAKPGVAQEAAAALAARHPGLQVVGVRDGYFKAEDEPALFSAIREARPDLLFVALGVPRQEKWLAAHQADLGVPVAMGVGGSFDVFAGRVQRAPIIFQRLHLEWLYRLIQEPWRFQRMQSSLPRFVLKVLQQA